MRIKRRSKLQRQARKFVTRGSAPDRVFHFHLIRGNKFR